jgi:hypothetical protein
VYELSPPLSSSQRAQAARVSLDDAIQVDPAGTSASCFVTPSSKLLAVEVSELSELAMLAAF